MNKILLVFLLLWVNIELSAETIVQQFTAISSGAGTVSDMDLPQPSAKGSVLIAMPVLLSPGVKVLSVTDNAPAGSNTYKQVPGTGASCANKSLDIWYCENCNAGVTELKFHLSGPVRGSLNAFLEVSGTALTSVLDGNGSQVSKRTGASAGLTAGPSITTNTKDFIVARYFSVPLLPTGVAPSEWKYNPSYVYVLDALPGTYQPTLTGAKSGTEFCMSVAAFKIAASLEPTKD